MRAAVYDRYGPPEVVHLADAPRPVPKDNEVLIRVRATTVSTADWRARSLNLPRGFGPLARLVFGISRPRRPILGTDLSGEIAAAGKGVTRWKPGDAVIAAPGIRMGAHAEYAVMPADGAIAAKPSNLTHEEAAALLFGGLCALDFFRRGGPVEAGQRVLVNGASGATGSAFVQLARHFGGTVTAVAGTRNLDLVRSLGASRAIDYTSEDFTRNGETYDLIIDTVGTAPFARVKASLKEKGRLFVVLGDFRAVISAPVQSMMSSRKVTSGTGAATAEDVRLLADLAARGEFRPVIDRTFPLSEIVEAHRLVDSGRKTGSVVVTMG
jgi:NADPH:quinone reductase-like Zn-dependent oxidoreductase